MKENYIKVYEYQLEYKWNDELEKERTNKKVWIQEILEENNIPYKEKVERYYIFDQPRYISSSMLVSNNREVMGIYVPIQFEAKVKGYIDEYNNTDNLIMQEIPELVDIEFEKEEKNVNEFEKSKKMVNMAMYAVLGIIIIMVLLLFLYGEDIA